MGILGGREASVSFLVPGAGYDDPLTIQGEDGDLGILGDREVSNQATRSSCPAPGR